MTDSWILWLMLAVFAVALGVFLSWIERRSSRKLFIGQPREYPSGLVNALITYLGTQDRVESAYLAQMFDGLRDVKPRLVIGIEVDGGLGEVQEECARIARGMSHYDGCVDFIALGDDEVSAYMRLQAEPFYRK